MPVTFHEVKIMLNAVKGPAGFNCSICRMSSQVCYLLVATAYPQIPYSNCMSKYSLGAINPLDLSDMNVMS